MSKTRDFTDQTLPLDPDTHGYRIARTLPAGPKAAAAATAPDGDEPDGGGGRRCLTNVPHHVVHHSPSGFEFGYGGSGPADLAPNLLEDALRRADYRGERVRCYRGRCFALAWRLHRRFKEIFFAVITKETPWSVERIRAWLHSGSWSPLRTHGSSAPSIWGLRSGRSHARKGRMESDPQPRATRRGRLHPAAARIA